MSARVFSAENTIPALRGLQTHWRFSVSDGPQIFDVFDAEWVHEEDGRHPSFDWEIDRREPTADEEDEYSVGLIAAVKDLLVNSTSADELIPDTIDRVEVRRIQAALDEAEVNFAKLDADTGARGLRR